MSNEIVTNENRDHIKYIYSFRSNFKYVSKFFSDDIDFLSKNVKTSLFNLRQVNTLSKSGMDELNDRITQLLLVTIDMANEYDDIHKKYMETNFSK